MTELRINLKDLHAVLDVLCDVTEAADSMSTEQALEFKHALDAIAAKAREASSLMKTQAINTLEGTPRQIGNTIYATKPTGKWRPNHDRIKSRIVSMALFDPVSGEVLHEEAIAQRAVHLTYELFVAPSDTPKKTGLKKLKLDTPDVCDWEVTGKELIEMIVDGGPE